MILAYVRKGCEKAELSTIQTLVMMKVAAGYTNKEIADKTSQSIDYIRNIGWQVRKKLGAKNRVHAVLKLAEEGMAS